MQAFRKFPRSMFSLASAMMLTVAAVACSDRQSPTGIRVSASRAADVVGSDLAYGERDYELTSFDVSTLTLSATSNLVPPNPLSPGDPYDPSDPYRTFTASFNTDTRFAPAHLDRYVPGDPYCPGLAANYNASLNVSTSDGGFYGVISDLAANHCNARVIVDLQSATIRSFQPVP